MTAGGIHFEHARGPDGTALYAVGDVHGRLDLLTRMHEAIAADRAKRGAADWRIIHLGDHVDRGPQTREVLDFLIEAGKDERVTMLAGNHDVGFLEFLERADPMSIFARYGGAKTALSYGVALDYSNLDAFEASQRRFVAAVPPSHIEFLRSLRFSVTMGDFYFCHAGVRPGIDLDLQDPNDLIWIREEFHRHLELLPKVVVHGHTPVEEPELAGNRVNLDTGAYSTGRLTALAIHGAEKEILEVVGPAR